MDDFLHMGSDFCILEVKHEECTDAVLDVYHRRNISEGINSYMKTNLGLETHVNGKGIKITNGYRGVLVSTIHCELDKVKYIRIKALYR